jgi:DNA-binding NarL/FixJ family response regulator
VKKIIIGERNNDFRKILCAALKKIPDIMVYEVTNGLEVVRKNKEVFPDIVLMCINMPLMSGLQAAKTLKKSKNASQVVIITGKDAPEYMEAAKKSGADYFLSKNFITLEDIVSLVQNLVTR